MATKRKDTKPTADQLEEQARQEWEEALELHLPGFAFADLPALYRLEGPKGSTVAAVGILARDRERWADIPARVRKAASYVGAKVPKGWNYAPQGEAHAFDLDNPRLYTLDGREVPGMASPMLQRSLFKDRLERVFREAPTNVKEAQVVAFLEHHRTNGGNPEALRAYVLDLLATLKPERLRQAVEAWHRESANAKPLPPPVKALRERFTPEQYRLFIKELKRCGIIDAGGHYIPSYAGKGALWGAYEGAAARCGVKKGNDLEMVATLNASFPDLGLSKARPQELRGTVRNVKMEEHFSGLPWP